MNRSKSLWFFAAALLLTLGLQEGRATACTQQCQGIGTGCSRCVDVGTPTNQTCINIGSCSCRYTNMCFGVVAKPKAQATQADIFAAPEAAPRPTAAVAFDVASLRVAQ